jgi:hypothetical protein
MNTLRQSIIDTVDRSILEYIKMVSDKYNINKDELISLYNQRVPESQVQNNTKTSSPTAVIMPLSVTPQNNVCAPVSINTTHVLGDNNSTSKTCPYEFVRGSLKGTICGCVVKKHDRVFCPKHHKKSNHTTDTSITRERKTTPVPPVISDKPSRLLVRHKTLDKMWHEDSGLVFRDKTDLTVIGKCVDSVIIPLTTDDVKTCIEHKFKYEKVVEENGVEEKVVEENGVEEKVVEEKVVEEKVVEEKVVEEKVVEEKVVEEKVVEEKVVEEKVVEENGVEEMVVEEMVVEEKVVKEKVVEEKVVEEKVVEEKVIDDEIETVENLLEQLTVGTSSSSDDNESIISDMSM